MPRSPDAKYVHYCDNETIQGVEFKGVPDVGNRVSTWKPRIGVDYVFWAVFFQGGFLSRIPLCFLHGYCPSLSLLLSGMLAVLVLILKFGF